ncbi:PREDICTED: uncharacterized protein CXorf67-like [Chrysochloris asiatica]|uniref:Uncharacterized protein CXorf67-like n=1 Tax=Chrysochloris asiatica TaxID=185453 RepID=A0A9B0WJH6_CHRAS|nr:PREDICTED: uncharacterized protein CXorf67-like [Chrysochloris asiatica]
MVAPVPRSAYGTSNPEPVDPVPTASSELAPSVAPPSSNEGSATAAAASTATAIWVPGEDPGLRSVDRAQTKRSDFQGSRSSDGDLANKLQPSNSCPSPAPWSEASRPGPALRSHTKPRGPTLGSFAATPDTPVYSQAHHRGDQSDPVPGRSHGSSEAPSPARGRRRRRHSADAPGTALVCSAEVPGPVPGRSESPSPTHGRTRRGRRGRRTELPSPARGQGHQVETATPALGRRHHRRVEPPGPAQGRGQHRAESPSPALGRRGRQHRVEPPGPALGRRGRQHRARLLAAVAASTAWNHQARLLAAVAANTALNHQARLLTARRRCGLRGAESLGRRRRRCHLPSPVPALHRCSCPPPGPARGRSLYRTVQPGATCSHCMAPLAYRSSVCTPTGQSSRSSLMTPGRVQQRSTLHSRSPPQLAGQNPPSSGVSFRRLGSPRLSNPPDSEVPSLASQSNRPVRMRASSPSPPGRFFPLPMLYGEGSSSPSPPSSPASSSSSSSPWFLGLDSISTPIPDSLRRALMPELDDQSPPSPCE